MVVSPGFLAEKKGMVGALVKVARTLALQFFVHPPLKMSGDFTFNLSLQCGGNPLFSCLQQVPLMDRSAPFMHDIVVTKEGVTKLLKGLNPSKAIGSDELHPRALKELALELGPVFAHLFQQSIDTGEIPKEWSLANICPLFKKGDRSLARNYRPVSLTCIPCKLLEHIVCSNIMTHLDEHELLSDRQHAFRKWHSCEIS